MSKPVKNLLTETYKRRFGDLNGAVVVDIRGVEANDNNQIRNDLATKHIRITMIKNSLARKAFAGTAMEQISEVISGPSSLAYPTSEDVSVVTVARELIDWAKKVGDLEFNGALMEGIVFGPDEIKKLSEYPTREEAHGQVVQIVLTPAQKLVGAVTSPAGNIAGIIKTIREKLEKGETIGAA